MVNRLPETCGTRRVAGTEAYHSFPAPAQLARLNPAEMRGLGLSAAKAAALTELAEGFASGRCSEEEIAALPSSEAIERLQSFTGVGAWSARYALLRGLGRLEQFPSGDVGAARALSELLGGGPLTPTQAESFAQNWKEYAGLMYFHVLGNRYLPEHREQLPLARVPLPLPLP